MTKTTTGSKLRDGMTYRTLDPFTKAPLGPWVKADRVLPARARGYLVVFVLGERNTRSLQTTTPIEIQVEPQEEPCRWRCGGTRTDGGRCNRCFTR